MKQLFFLLIILAVGALKVDATAQCGDILIWGKDTFSLFADPLVKREDIKRFRKDLDKLGVTIESTACWRGYIATWGIEGDELYLLRVQGEREGSLVDADLNVLFPGEVINGKVKADWFSGSLYLPLGECLYYVHDEYASIYEKEIELVMKEGRVVERVDYDNSRTHRSEYTKDWKVLQRWIYSNIDWEKLPKVDSAENRVYLRVCGTESRKLEVELIRGCGITAFDDEALRVVSLLPDWDVVYRRGKIIRIRWMIPVKFSREMKGKYARLENGGE